MEAMPRRDAGLRSSALGRASVPAFEGGAECGHAHVANGPGDAFDRLIGGLKEKRSVASPKPRDLLQGGAMQRTEAKPAEVNLTGPSESGQLCGGPAMSEVCIHPLPHGAETRKSSIRLHEPLYLKMQDRTPGA